MYLHLLLTLTQSENTLISGTVKQSGLACPMWTGETGKTFRQGLSHSLECSLLPCRNDREDGEGMVTVQPDSVHLTANCKFTLLVQTYLRVCMLLWLTHIHANMCIDMHWIVAVPTSHYYPNENGGIQHCFCLNPYNCTTGRLMGGWWKLKYMQGC